MTGALARVTAAAAAAAAALRGAPARCACGDPCGRCGGCDECCACPPGHACSPSCVHAAMALLDAGDILAAAAAAAGVRP